MQQFNFSAHCIPRVLRIEELQQLKNKLLINHFLPCKRTYVSKHLPHKDSNLLRAGNLGTRGTGGRTHTQAVKIAVNKITLLSGLHMPLGFQKLPILQNFLKILIKKYRVSGKIPIKISIPVQNRGLTPEISLNYQ